MLAPGRPDRRRGQRPVKPDVAARGRVEAEHQLEERALAAAGRTGECNEGTGRHFQVDIVENERLAGSVAKRHAPHRDAAPDRAGDLGLHARRIAFRVHDVAKPVQMKMQVGELHDLVDERKAPVGERLPEAHEGEQHPDGEVVAGNDLPRRQVHDKDDLETGNHALAGCHADRELARRERGVHHVGVPIPPHALAFGLAARQLDDGRRPQALDQVRVCLGGRDDAFLGAPSLGR